MPSAASSSIQHFGSNVVDSRQPSAPFIHHQIINHEALRRDQLSSMFASSVLNGQGDFAQSYSLLKQACDGTPGISTPLQISLDMMDRMSPMNTCKRFNEDFPVEPLKLSASKPKRVRSCTIVVPDKSRSNSVVDDDNDEPELAFSRSNSPITKIPQQMSPRRPLSTTSRLTEKLAERELLNKSPRQVKNGLGGERRLSITFHNNGVLQEPIQRFGKFNLLIRDGLSGTHTMYAQPWRFEINHQLPGDAASEMRLRWTVVNLASHQRVSFLETAEQAHERQVKGNTICNLVVREALNKRASELEEELRNLDPSNHTRVANLKSLIKELRPKQCTEGLLFFGLRHQVAQHQRKIVQ